MVYSSRKIADLSALVLPVLEPRLRLESFQEPKYTRANAPWTGLKRPFA